MGRRRAKRTRYFIRVNDPKSDIMANVKAPFLSLLTFSVCAAFVRAARLEDDPCFTSLLPGATSIDCCCKGLTGTIPASIGDYTNLVHVNLGGAFGTRNDLSGKIPLTFGKLTDLQRLDLSRNKLTGKVPDELGDLSALTRVDLYSNQLSGCVPKCLGLCASTTAFFPCFITTYETNKAITGRCASECSPPTPGPTALECDLDLGGRMVPPLAAACCHPPSWHS